MSRDFLRWMGWAAVLAMALALAAFGTYELHQSTAASAANSQEATQAIQGYKTVLRNLKAEVADHTVELQDLVTLTGEIQSAISSRDLISAQAALAIHQIEQELVAICHETPRCTSVPFTPVFTTTTTTTTTTAPRAAPGTTTTTAGGRGRPGNLLPTLPHG